MNLSKRDMLGALVAGLSSSLLPATVGAEEKSQKKPSATGHAGHTMPEEWKGKEQIAFLAYPGFTALDLVGPHYMLGNLWGAKTHIVAKTKEPVVSDMKLTIMPSTTFDECPANLDIICVPGGTTGTLAAMEDEATIAFLKDRGSRARYVTSVCTGSLLLGAAGLLAGYKATSHWGAREVLRDFGAEPVDARVVSDRNRITGAGVTAGLDFGLTLVSRLRDQQYAEGLQLLAEYDPAPPFNAGSPAKASAANRDMMTAMFADFVSNAREVAKRRTGK